MFLRACYFVAGLPKEACFWLAALVALAVVHPAHAGPHFSLCPLYLLGFDFCPGCGLGRSISCLFHGEVIRSLSTHPLGIFAVIVLSFRIISLVIHYIKPPWQK